MTAALGAGAVWIVLGGLYLLFAGQASLPEGVAAGLCAAAAAALQFATFHRGDRRFRFAVPWARLAGRLLASLALETPRVGWELARVSLGLPSRGGNQRIPFTAGGAAPRDVARRSLVILAASVAPNSAVVGVDPHALIVHRLAPQKPPADRDWPL